MSDEKSVDDWIADRQAEIAEALDRRVDTEANLARLKEQARQDDPTREADRG